MKKKELLCNIILEGVTLRKLQNFQIVLDSKGQCSVMEVVELNVLKIKREYLKSRIIIMEKRTTIK